MAKDGDVPQRPASEPEIHSVLSGSNARYLEAQYARYEADPSSVAPDWREFFEREADAADAAFDGPSWARNDWPPKVNGELTAALDGDWASLEPQLKAKIETRAAAAPPVASGDVMQATKDSLRALMLIRAYRIRGHLIADLDQALARARKS